MTYKSKPPLKILVSFRLVEALESVLQGIGAYIRKQQLHWQIRCVDSNEFEPNLDPALVDGVMTVLTVGTKQALDHVQKSGIPVVNLLHDLHPLLPSVCPDNHQIGRIAGEYLIGRGFRRFGYLGFHSPWSETRRDGFNAAVQAAGHTLHDCEALARTTDYNNLGSSRTVERLRDWVRVLPRPIALMACSDFAGSSLVAACKEEGLAILDDVAVIGVDNLVWTCELAAVPLSSVAQDFTKMGFEAARILDNILSGRGKPENVTLIEPAGVVTRLSTDVFAYNEPYVADVIRAVHEHADKGISMKELLQRVPVSRRWLDERFKAAIGHTVSDEIRKVRLAHLRDLLLRTDLSVKQIAARSGFSCAENMTRFFRDGYGLAPNAYRMRYTRSSV